MRTRPPGTLSVARWPQRYRDDPFVWTALFRLAQDDAAKGRVA